MELKNDTIEKKQYFTFVLKNELFCIEVLPIKEIIEYINITRVPMMQTFVKGITNVRGNVIPVIDLNERLGLGRTEIGKKTCIVIVETIKNGQNYDMGILIDSINQVMEMEAKDFENTPDFGSKIEKKFIHKIGKIDDKFIDILNLDAILDIDELSKIIKKN
ncbi:MAG: chemotaxis protein CheW [Candidatus Delongbacteria bacterium]|nr:chemotaxis protein CheW [Candidatus Delongbacteria bacterium]MBN2833797.1 chemotaxis protein CheW [Candidatus Delongbacteria bacterium]